jgi:Xaa-Pro dipeptidase
MGEKNMTSQNIVVAPGIECVFPQEEIEHRLQAARQELKNKNIDIMLVTGPENIFYLTGQQSPGYYTYQALLLPKDADPVFIVRQLELNNLIANTRLDLKNVYPYADNADPVDVTIEVINKLGWGNKRIAINQREWFFPVAIYKALQKKLGELGDATGIIEGLRAVKSPKELKKIEQAALYVDAGIKAGLASIKAGTNENAIVSAMMGQAIAAGSEYVGMEPLMASGTRCGVPHGTWRRNLLKDGDPVFLEMAACHDRYHAALMRTAWLGKVPDEAQKMMATCQEGLSASLTMLKPGNTCEQVHDACQKIIDRDGFTKNYKKRTGYSIGTAFAPDWGEGNILSLYTGVKTILKPGMVFHIPPALRIYGVFTVGVSETAIVTEDGCKTLSSISRDLNVF